MRLMADFQNYKKRVEKEKKDLYSYANEKLVTELLDVLDNFERALDQEGQGDSFKEGMEMIFKQLGDVLKKSGLAEIPALGEEFDPNFHNAVMSLSLIHIFQPADAGGKSGDFRREQLHGTLRIPFVYRRHEEEQPVHGRSQDHRRK